MKAVLALENGIIFRGNSFGALRETVGEVVFNTGMTGYQELLTDPSYYGQIVTMTYPLIGNYGINTEDLESLNPKVRGFVVRELCKAPSNWRSTRTLDDYLKEHDIVGIEGIDTRALTKTIRDNGTLRGIIAPLEGFDFDKIYPAFAEFSVTDAVANVTTASVKHFPGNGPRIAVIDYGIKTNILRSLLNRDCEIYLYPAFSTAAEVLSCNPAGILLSNGPGDPKDCQPAIQTLRDLYGRKPIFGICLGHQLLALAKAADTGRLKYGHRGCNHPVKDLKKDLTYITSQNHGYSILHESLSGKPIEITHINLNDNSIEGVRYLDAPVFSVQFHPEAAPGPKDTAYLFDEFMAML
ncbi:MAG: carbamoyl phosphate synthase small subunit [Negativicutes bacterium]|jgi:carbamoyl-phosphate synthase small subunit